MQTTNPLPSRLKSYLTVTGILLGLMALAFFLFYKIVLYNAPTVDLNTLPLSQKVSISIPRGSSLHDISQILEESGIVDNANLFVYAAKFSGLEKELKAGQYLLPRRASNYQVLHILESTRPQSVKITIPEGKDHRYIIRTIRSRMPVDSVRFVQTMRDSTFARELSIRDTSLLGYLMPNTYFFDPGSTERDIIRTMVREFHSVFTTEWERRARELQMTPHQIVTLASIIEGETGDEQERFLVSSVYHNRLRRHMLLQADPTVQFIIPDGPRRLYTKDLEIDHPYNTYRFAGLPPGPINNPGKDALLAALYPAKTDFLYMVADGTGKHIFSRSMDEHLIARRHLDKMRREMEKDSVNAQKK
jgi:UPF0755 protein